MYEHHTQPLLPRWRFATRLLGSLGVGVAVIGASLGVGMWGYHHFEGLSWLDAFLNASMILSGMGPLHAPATSGGKLFAGCYALYSGLVVILITGIVFAPFVHRLLHRFHLERSHRHTPPRETDETSAAP
jgi:hypothetical protein